MKWKEELNKNYPTQKEHFNKVDWDSISKIPSLKAGVVLTLKINQARTFVLTCDNPAIKNADPFIWKDEWHKYKSQGEVPEGYLWRNGTCSEKRKEAILFSDPACCDVVPSNSIDCAFNLQRVCSRDDLERCSACSELRH